MPVEEPGDGLPRCPVLPGPTRSVKRTANSHSLLFCLQIPASESGGAT